MRHYGIIGTICLAMAALNAVGLSRLGMLPVLLWGPVLVLAFLDFRGLSKIERPIQFVLTAGLLLGFNAERLQLGPLGATWVFLGLGTILIVFQARNREHLASGRMPYKQRLFWWTAVLVGIAMTFLLAAAFG